MIALLIHFTFPKNLKNSADTRATRYYENFLDQAVFIK